MIETISKKHYTYYIEKTKELKRLANQDVETFFNELYDSTREKVLSYIIAKCGNTEDIADIFQETYTELVRVIQRRGIAHLEKPEAFVMQLAKRKIYRHYKLLERWYGRKIEWDEAGPDREIGEPEEVSFEELVITKEIVERAADYLKQKDDLTKKIFYLHFYMDKRLREIAGLLDVKESTVKNKLYRTLKELKKYLVQEGMV